jgi:hypothetical protein
MVVENKERTMVADIKEPLEVLDSFVSVLHICGGEGRCFQCKAKSSFQAVVEWVEEAQKNIDWATGMYHVCAEERDRLRKELEELKEEKKRAIEGLTSFRG